MRVSYEEPTMSDFLAAVVGAIVGLIAALAWGLALLLWGV
jgi:hypothetical protein